jgi:hypothetical protein
MKCGDSELKKWLFYIERWVFDRVLWVKWGKNCDSDGDFKNLI